MMKILMKKNFKNELILYSHEASTGIDRGANIYNGLVLKPKQRVLIKTGLTFEINVGYGAQIRSRNDLAVNNRITIVNFPGTGDADY